MRVIGKKLLLSFLGIFLVNLVGAFNGFGYYSSPLETLLNNEMLRFALIFVLFFVVVFYATSKVFKENKAIAAVVGVVIAFFITGALVRGGFFYGYLDEDITMWALFVAVLVGIGVALKFAYSAMGKWSVLVLWLIWGVIAFGVDAQEVFPYSDIGDIFLYIYNVVFGWIGFIILIIVSVIIIKKKEGLVNKILKKFGLD
jgi:hypothetical protein